MREGVAPVRVKGRYEIENEPVVSRKGRRATMVRLVYELEGTLRFDVARGRPAGGEVSLVIDMDMIPEGPPAGVHTLSRLPVRYTLASRP